MSSSFQRGDPNPAPLDDEAASDNVAGALVANKYRLVTLLADGGMGSVWLARHEALDARVAIKLIHPALRSEEASQRLLAEARIEAQLNHPHIVRVLDYGEVQPATPFLVMELLCGRTLRELLREQTRLTPEAAVQILLPVIDALQCAHEHGVVHCDLKPDNIFLTGDSRHIHPKLIDFGIAKCEDVDSFDFLSRGTVLGSPAYMAPEQARGETDIDARADIWALCVVLYEAITGQAAFDGDTYSKLLHAVIHHQVPPLRLEGAGMVQLSTILQRGLSKDRARRFQTIEELGDTLACWLEARGVEHDICGAWIPRHWHVHHAPLEPVEVQATVRLTRSAPKTSEVPEVLPSPWRSASVAIPKRVAARFVGYATAAAIGLGLLGYGATLYGRPRAHIVMPAAPEAQQLTLAAKQCTPNDTVSIEANARAPRTNQAPAQHEPIALQPKPPPARASGPRVDAARLDLKDPYSSRPRSP